MAFHQCWYNRLRLPAARSFQGYELSRYEGNNRSGSQMKISKYTYLTAAIFASVLSGAGTHAASPTVEVYKSATCKCCAKWVDHMRANGFTVNTHDIGNKEAREKAGISPTLGS